MLRSKHLVGLILAATLIATMLPFSTLVYAQNQDEKFKEIAEQAKEKVDELGAHIGDALDITWPDGFPDDIKTLYDDASAELAAGDYKDAMKAYREVFEMLNIYAETEGLVFEGSGGDDAQELVWAIDRAYERIERIEDAKDTYLDLNPSAGVSDVEGNLSWAIGNLSEAEGALVPPPNIEWAAGNLTEANHNIADAFAALRELASWTNAWRIESFLMGIRKSFERALELLERQGVTPDPITVGYIEGNITDARTAMIEAMEHWIAGEKELAKMKHREAIEKLMAARDSLKLLRPHGSKGGSD